MRVRISAIDEVQLFTCFKHKLWGARRGRFRNWLIGDYLLLLVEGRVAALAQVSGAPFVSTERIWDNRPFLHRIPIAFVSIMLRANRLPVRGEVGAILRSAWGPTYGWGILNQVVLEGELALKITSLVLRGVNDSAILENNFDYFLKNAMSIRPQPVAHDEESHDENASKDVFSKEKRSRIMRSIKSTNTSIEMLFRKALWRAGVRGWRLHPKNVIGRPDITFHRKQVAVFIDGCFWHGCPSCYKRPKSNQGYWDTKILSNTSRDRSVTNYLVEEGWTVLRFWEHDIRKDKELCVQKVANALDPLFIKK